MSELKFRNYVNIEGKPVLFNELNEKLQKEISEKISRNFYHAAGLDVTLNINEKKPEKK